jgi:cell division protein FtsB
MLCVLAALLYLYLGAGLKMFTTWRQAQRDERTVSVLQREHTRLERQRAYLVRPETVELQARRLGMVKAGEQPYVVGGLPGG